MEKNSFRPHHIPKFSVVLIRALKTPLLMYFAVTGNVIMFGGAYVFHLLEFGINTNLKNFGDSLWWALCTISTVGYGDIVPVTFGGRLVAVVLIIAGVTFFLSFMAVLVSVMSAMINDDDRA